MTVGLIYALCVGSVKSMSLSLRAVIDKLSFFLCLINVQNLFVLVLLLSSSGWCVTMPDI